MAKDIHMVARHSAGFTLVELTVAMAVVTGLAMVILSLTVASTESLRSGAVAQQYRMLSQSVATFMGRHHAALAALPAACSEVALKASEAPLANSASCQIIGLPGQSVANGLQPTVAELTALHLLDSNFSSKLLLPYKSIVQMPNGNTAPASLAVQITKECGTSTPCDKGYRLLGLVFNQQPYDFERQVRQTSVRQNILEAFALMGGSAAVALSISSTDASELMGFKNVFQITNPVRSSSGGVPGVLAMRSDFNSLSGVSSSDSLGAYANNGEMWDFSGQSLRGLTSLAASSIGANQIKTNRLSVNGDSDFQQLSAQAISSHKIKLPLAVAGSACQAHEQSVAAAGDGSGSLLVCPNSGIWKIYQPTSPAP